MTELITHEKKIKVLRSTANGEEDKRFGTTQINNYSGVNKVNLFAHDDKVINKKQEEKRLHPINFDGIIGHEDLKQEILYAILGKLNEDEISKKYLASIDYHAVTGILLYGLPGVGKSSIMREIEKSLKDHPDLDCKRMDCSDFQGNVGTNAKIINDIFASARNTTKKACVILIDEIDSVLMKKRGHVNVAERTNAMQSNMDGMEDSSKIILIASTNYIDGMEEASLSRFVIINLGLPTTEERKEFIKRHISTIPMETEIDIDKLADFTIGFTGRNFRDLGLKLNRIRTISKKPITRDDLLKQIGHFSSIVGRNLNTTKSNEQSKDSMLSIIKDNNTNNNNNREQSNFTQLDNNGTELTKNILSFESSWGLGHVNSSNLVEFSIRFIDAFNPQYPTTGDYYSPSAIRGIAAKIFKITPGVN